MRLQVVATVIDLQTTAGDVSVPVNELHRVSGHIRWLIAIDDLLTDIKVGSYEPDIVLRAEVMDKLDPLIRSIAGGRSIRFDIVNIPGRR